MLSTCAAEADWEFLWTHAGYDSLEWSDTGMKNGFSKNKYGGGVSGGQREMDVQNVP